MTSHSTVLCLLASLLLLPSCNKDSQTDTGGSGTSSAEPVVPEVIPADDELANEPDARPIRLELHGLRLGESYDEVYERIHSAEPPQVSGIWADKKGGTGVLEVRPMGGAKLPADDYCFIEGRCVGIFQRMELSLDDYLLLVRQLAVTYDPATESPPEWAADDPLIKGLPKLEGASQRIFWSDPGRKEVLILQRIFESSHFFAALYRPKDVAAELGIEYSDLAEVFKP